MSKQMMTTIVRELSSDLESKRELSIVFTDNLEIKELNSSFRKKDKATDVLSFPCEDDDYLGDLIISVEKAEAQAKEYDCSLKEELVRLIIHGYLHLNGYDHVGVSRSLANKMIRKEDKLMNVIKEKWLN